MGNESREQYLLKNTVIFAIGNLGNKLIIFFLTPLYTFALTSEQYGIINSLLSVCALLVPITMCNISESIRRYLLDDDVRKVQAVEFIWFGISIIISAIIYFTTKKIAFLKDYAILICLYTSSTAFSLTTFEYLRGLEKFKQYTICGILQTSIIAALNFILLVEFSFGISGYFISYIVSFYLCSIIAFILAKQHKTMRFMLFEKSLLKKMSIFSLMLVPNSIMWWITEASDKLMISYFVSNSDTGIYSVATKLPAILYTANSIFMQAWQFSAIRESKTNDKNEYNSRMFMFYVRTISFLGAGLLFINRPFMNLYVSKEFREAIKYTPFLISAAMLSTLSTFVGTSYYVEKDMKGNLKSAILGAIFNISLNILLIPFFHVYGAAFATLVSYGVVLGFRIIDTQKYMMLKINKSLCFDLFLVILIMLVCSFIPSLTIQLFFEAIGFFIIIYLNRTFLYYFFINVKARFFRGETEQ